MKFDEQINEILSDRISGSVGLAKKFIDAVLECQPSGDKINESLYKIETTFPEMNVFSKIREHILKKQNDGDHVIDILRELKQQISQSNQKMALIARKFITPQSVILTFSNSQTLKDILLAVKAKAVIVPLSEPGGEGKQLYYQLSKHLEARLIPDSKIETFLKEINPIVTLSCDSVVPQTGFINKVGTKHLCLLAEKFGSTVLLFGGWLKEAENPPNEVNSPLLEWIPWFSNLEYITDYDYKQKNA